MLNGLMGQLWPDYYTSPTGGGIDWGQIISQGIGVTGSVLTNNPYYSPDDPRYRYPAPSTQQQQQRTQYPVGTYPTGSYQPSATGAGIQLSNQTLLFIGIGVLAFVLGSRRR
jgi:hypothetical protein